MTWNPFIALALQRTAETANDVGVVAVLSKEGGRTDCLGAVTPLDLTELDRFKRPHQQEAAFITSRYPELFEDYIPDRKYSARVVRSSKTTILARVARISIPPMIRSATSYRSGPGTKSSSDIRPHRPLT